MKLGYNTNGFSYHRLPDAVAILAELGYQSVAITLDYHHLNPFAPDLAQQVRETRSLLVRERMDCVIETGARFLLNPRIKHQPTLVSKLARDRQCRLDFLKQAIEVAAELRAEAVSFWSGAPDDAAPEEELWDRLLEGCRAACEHALKHRVPLAFEPEPGMFIDRMDHFRRLHEEVNHPSFGLTLDVGHLHCLQEGNIGDHIRAWKPWLWNVHIEDMRAGIHEHLLFGEGEMDFPPILEALREIDYQGGVHVELSRHAHDAVRTAQSARLFLQIEPRRNERK